MDQKKGTSDAWCNAHPSRISAIVLRTPLVGLLECIVNRAGAGAAAENLRPALVNDTAETDNSLPSITQLHYYNLRSCIRWML